MSTSTDNLNFEMVRVTWHDAHSTTDGWMYEDEIDDLDPLPVYHVGYLLPYGKGGKKNHITLAFGFTDDGALDTRMHIPKKMVVKIERLEANGAKRLGRDS